MTQFLLVLTVMFSIGAQAQEREGVRRTMRSIGAQFQILSRALLKGEPTPDESIQAAADTLVNLSIEASTQMPNSMRGTPLISELPEYDRSIALLVEQAKALRASLKSGDKAKAAEILRQGIVPLAQAAHSRWK